MIPSKTMNKIQIIITGIIPARVSPVMPYNKYGM